MTSKKDPQNLHPSQAQTRPSEDAVLHLLEEAQQQYEEYMRIADLADASAEDEIFYPRYAWDNPIGLVTTEPLDAELV